MKSGRFEGTGTGTCRPWGRRKVLAALGTGAAGLSLAGVVRAAEAPTWPAVSGAVFALRTARITDPVVAFDAKGRELLGFNCLARGRALPGRSFELVCGGGSFVAREAGAWIGAKAGSAEGFSLELTLSPASAAPEEPGTVVAYGDATADAVALVQDKEALSLHLAGRQPSPLFAVAAGRAVHVVVTCGAGGWVAYRNGEKAGSGPLEAGPGRWPQGDLAMGASVAGSRPWLGRLEAVAIFPGVLSAAEAAAEAAAARALAAGRTSPAAIRFQGVLLRQAVTATLEDIRPYSRSLTAAEYRVEKVLTGTWNQPTITVLHWMIMDGRRLPIADRRPGAAVELTVEPLDQQPQLEGSRRDELADGDLDAEMHYCERE